MSTATQEVRELKQELRNLATLVQKNIKHANGNSTASNVAHLINFDTDELRKMANKAGKDVRSFISKKADDATELYHTAEKTVAENPVRSVVLSLVAGMALASLFSSRRSRD
jgi:ElaB/YqjD/DUF883 family membrane-anchored ribosome-binding protein